MATEQPVVPWVVVAPSGVHWLGHARHERDAWEVALGWPHTDEVAAAKASGWYAAEATVTWKPPSDVREDGNG